MTKKKGVKKKRAKKINSPRKKLAKKKTIKKKSKKKFSKKKNVKKVKHISKKNPKKDNRGFFSKLFHLSKNKPVKMKKPQKERKRKIKSKNDSKKVSLKQVMKKELILDKKFQKQIPRKRPMTKKRKSKKAEPINKNLKKIKHSPRKIISSKKKGMKKPIKKEVSYIHTGIKGFDALFEKNSGIPTGAAVLIEGGPGSGKTIFCLATVNELCKKGKKCLYMSFEESQNQLVNHMEGLGWNPKEFIKKKLLRVERFDAIDISRSIEALLSAAKKELLIDVEPMFFPPDFKPDFVVIDSLTSIASAFSGEESRFRIYMEQLFRYLEKHQITNFLIREIASPSHIGTTFKEEGEAVSFLSDGIIVLYNIIYNSGRRGSALEILKMRGSSFKKNIVEMKITNKKGLEVFPNKIIKKSTKNNFNLT